MLLDWWDHSYVLEQSRRRTSQRNLVVVAVVVAAFVLAPIAEVFERSFLGAPYSLRLFWPAPSHPSEQTFADSTDHHWEKDRQAVAVVALVIVAAERD